MKIDRLIGIVILLLNRRHLTAGQLAEYFEVSDRTIYRDLDSLDRAGVPIVTSQGTGGGIELAEGYVLDRQIVAARDLSSIVTALKGLSSLIDDESYAATREKVESMIPAHERVRLRREQEVVQVDLVPWGYGERMRDLLNLLRRAAIDQRVVRFRYGSASGEITERSVEPISLHLKGFTWYLYAYCRLRREERLFKLARMSRVEIVAEHFRRRDRSTGSAEPAALRPAGAPVWDDQRPPTELLLHFAADTRARVEEYFGHDSVEDRDGHLEVRVAWPIDEWVYGFLLSFGADLTVAEPHEVADEVHRRARRMARNYEKNSIQT